MRRLVLGLVAILLAGCNRSTLTLTAAPFHSQPKLPTVEAPVQPTSRVEAPAKPVLPAVPSVEQTALAAIAEQGGIINDLPSMTARLDQEAYQVQVVPSSSQDKADKIAKAWASDARQLYVIWAYWKLPILSITRHCYYSPSKGVALKVEFTLSSLFAKSVEEPADGFDQATLVLNEARDRHAFGVKEAHAIARKAGYIPSTYGAAVMLDMKTYGPMWVFADMPTQTQGTPVMLVNAATGMVTQGGEALMLAKYMFKRAGY